MSVGPVHAALLSACLLNIWCSLYIYRVSQKSGMEDFRYFPIKQSSIIWLHLIKYHICQSYITLSLSLRVLCFTQPPLCPNNTTEKIKENPVSTPLDGHYHNNRPTPRPRKAAMLVPSFLWPHYCRLVSELYSGFLLVFFIFQASIPGELVSCCFFIVPPLFEVFFYQNSFFILVLFQVENDLLNLVFFPPIQRLTELFRYGSCRGFFSHTVALTELCVLTVAIV